MEPVGGFGKADQAATNSASSTGARSPNVWFGGESREVEAMASHPFVALQVPAVPAREMTRHLDASDDHQLQCSLDRHLASGLSGKTEQPLDYDSLAVWIQVVPVFEAVAPQDTRF